MMNGLNGSFTKALNEVNEYLVQAKAWEGSCRGSGLAYRRDWGE